MVPATNYPRRVGVRTSDYRTGPHRPVGRRELVALVTSSTSGSTERGLAEPRLAGRRGPLSAPRPLSGGGVPRRAVIALSLNKKQKFFFRSVRNRFLNCRKLVVIGWDLRGGTPISNDDAKKMLNIHFKPVPV